MKELTIVGASKTIPRYSYWSIRDEDDNILSESETGESFESEIKELKALKAFDIVQVWYGSSPNKSTKGYLVLNEEVTINPQQAMTLMGTRGSNGQPANVADMIKKELQAHTLEMNAKLAKQQANFEKALALREIEFQKNLANQELNFAYVLLEMKQAEIDKREEAMREKEEDLKNNPLQTLGGVLGKGALTFADQTILGGMFTGLANQAEDQEDAEDAEYEEDQEAGNQATSEPKKKFSYKPKPKNNNDDEQGATTAE